MIIAKLGEGLGGKLGEQWAAAILTPAFVFWIGGLAAWMWARGFAATLTTLDTWVRGQSVITQAGLAVGVLFVLAASGLLAQRLTFPTLQILEGYWPRVFAPLRRFLLARVTRRVQAAEQRWHKLTDKITRDKASAEDHNNQRDLDLWLRLYPPKAGDYMPTRLGNILRAAESWPGDKYGLDAVKCWPSLWLVLPESTRHELTTARARLDSAAASWLWGVLFVVWTPWTWWALLVAVTAGLLGYYVWILSYAQSYGKLIEAAFDVHRSALYHALRWPLPATPSKERESGKAITLYLWRGSDQSLPTFVKARE